MACDRFSSTFCETACDKFLAAFCEKTCEVLHFFEEPYCWKQQSIKKLNICGYGEIGRRVRLRILCPRRGGSSPFTRTKKRTRIGEFFCCAWDSLGYAQQTPMRLNPHGVAGARRCLRVLFSSFNIKIRSVVNRVDYFVFTILK